MEIREALTFDDVLLVPGASEVMPAEADTRTQVTKSVALNIPLIIQEVDSVHPILYPLLRRDLLKHGPRLVVQVAGRGVAVGRAGPGRRGRSSQDEQRQQQRRVDGRLSIPGPVENQLLAIVQPRQQIGGAEREEGNQRQIQNQ